MTNLSELDIIFISYDEPNADKHWADLLSKVPWAKRVHGVEGSDSAHKAAADLSATERFISVDADNIIDQEFFNLEYDFEHEKFKNKVISWAAVNDINNLYYGNGGLKCWPVDYVTEMKTHENSEDDKKSAIEFCWDKERYVQMNNVYCRTYPNGSPLQAFRAGFREGVKLSLNEGKKVKKSVFEKSIWWGNFHRLLVWMNIGQDANNGLWAIYGARLGCYMTNLTDWDFVNVRDFTYINNLWYDDISLKFEGSDNYCYETGYSYDYNHLLHESKELGQKLSKELKIDIVDLDSNQSKFFKKTYVGLPRTGHYVTEEEMLKIRASNK